jgi:hypothetical protein
MKSKNDPILDAQAICQEHGPLKRDYLVIKLQELGWHPQVVTDAIEAAIGVYLKEGPDGKLQCAPPPSFSAVGQADR